MLLVSWPCFLLDQGAGPRNLCVTLWGWSQISPARPCFVSPCHTHLREINSTSPTNASLDYLHLPIIFLNKFLHTEWTFKFFHSGLFLASEYFWSQPSWWWWEGSDGWRIYTVKLSLSVRLHLALCHQKKMLSEQWTPCFSEASICSWASHCCDTDMLDGLVPSCKGLAWEL